MRSKGAKFLPGPALLLIAFGLSGQDAAWKRLNDQGNRYEGTVTRPHAARNYELRGFHAFRENTPLDGKTSLKLQFYLPGNDKAFVSAREIREEKQYLMIAKEDSVSLHPGSWSTFTGWGTQELARQRISTANLGVIVRLKNDAEYNEEIAPAVLTAQNSAPPPISEYTLYLSIGVRLSQLQCQVTGSGGYSATVPCRGAEARSVVPIRIPASGLPAGPVTLQLDGKVANTPTEKFTARFRFYHQPL